MANKRQLNDYEKAKLSRVRENQERLRSLGVKNLANSLTSLVHSKNPKKKKMNQTSFSSKDVDYNPEMGDDRGEEYPEFATSVEVAKKQHRPIFLAPMSIKKMASSARQHRVIAPKVSDSNIIKENHSKKTLTMGELISSNKRTRQREALKQNLTKPTSIKQGSKKGLVLVDEDDDEDDDDEDDDEDDDVFQEIEDDANEGYIMRSQAHGNQDDEYEDRDLTASANNDEEIQGDDSHDDSEDEDVALIPDQLHSPDLEKAIETTKINTRGPTMLHAVHTRKIDEREVIICNEFGQPVGPSTKENDVVGRFSRFLGTIARNHTYAPLIHPSWTKVPHKDKMWEYVLEKYDVPSSGKTWVLKTIGNLYKLYKSRFKKKHFTRHKDKKTCWKNRPDDIPEADFAKLLNLWSKKDVVKRCSEAKERRMSQKNMHTAGPKSFARIREEMRNEDPNKELPSLTKIFERTRKRTEGRVYLDTYDDTANKIEQMKKYKPPEDGRVVVDPFTSVMNENRGSYLRLYGRGVTKKMMKTLGNGEEAYMNSGELMESFKTSLEEEKAHMQKEIEEDQQRKKAELEAMHKDLDNKQANLEAMMRDIMEKL